MALNGTRGLIRIARNPDCEWLAAMVAEASVDERQLYEEVTAGPYPGDYGEKPSAIRRGNQFEARLYANDAARLKRALQGIYRQGEPITVRNLAEELPGGVRDTVRAQRLARTNSILRDLAQGKTVPDLVVQPQFRLSVGDSTYRYIVPDFMLLDPQRSIYVPGEAKSNIVRGGVVDPVDRENARLQAGGEVLGLRTAATGYGLADRVTDRALFIYSGYRGLGPRPAAEESVAAEVRSIEQALAILPLARQQLILLRQGNPAPLRELWGELGINFQSNCIGRCAFAELCQQQVDGQARSLGDAATRLFGAETDVDRLVAIALGQIEAATPVEAAMAARVAAAWQSIGITGVAA